MDNPTFSLDIDDLITDEVMDKGTASLGGWPMAECDMPDAAGAVLQQAGPYLVATALRQLSTRRAFAGQTDLLQALAKGLEERAELEGYTG
jgi:hypothetical protein